MTLLPYLFFICISLLAGVLGSVFTLDQIPTWYASLSKPSWTPPNLLFGPVWNVLYVMMGIAAGLVWTLGTFGRFFVIWFFLAHLVVNALWSVAFFGLHELLLSLWIIGLLWVLIVLLIVLFARHSKLAAWLLVPYLLWVSYATTLNAGILFLN